MYRVQRKEPGRTQENIDIERRGKHEAEAKLAARQEKPGKGEVTEVKRIETTKMGEVKSTKF